jgi:CDP-4-dehydro-6-deoxyglucose reductase
MTARLVASVPLSPDIRHFLFEVPEVSSLSFEPGQFVSLVEHIRGKEVTRAYSLAAPPAGNRFELCLNLVHDGLFSPYLFALRPGDPVTVKAILGTFVWKQPVRDSALVATGTGIAPFRGMLTDLFSRGTAAQITLIFGARHPHGLVYQKDFEKLAAAHPNFRFLPTVTRPDAEWTGRTGRVQPLLEEVLGDRRDVDVYLCGLKAMVDETRALLKARGFDRKQIIAEKFD